jgi:hypothetical protein
MVLVLTGLLVALFATTFAVTDNGTPKSTTTTLAELTGAALELAELMESRQGEEYHARYEGESVDGASVVIETWQDGEGGVRQDQILTAGEQGAHLVSIDGKDGAVRCTRLEEEWSCRQAAPAELAASDPLAAIRARLAEGKVTARNEQVDGEPARCFELGADVGSELCVQPATGIPMRISAGETELRLVVLEATVDPAAFEPPGPVT